jgi:predicted NBD/HSP70 family sugar kinase
MDEVIKDGTEMTVGVDLGDKWSRLCVLDEHGEVCEEGRIATTTRRATVYRLSNRWP